MEIRKMTGSDYEDVNKPMQQVHQLHMENRPDLYVKQEPFFLKREYLDLIEDGNTIAIVAEKDGKAVGLCMVSMRR